MLRNSLWMTLMLCITSSTAFGFFGTVNDYAIMLTSNDRLDVRYAAKLMHKNFNGNRTVNDIASKRLWGG